MNNLETNALRIWELLNKAEGNSLLSKKYREYRGLMPIVFECNSGDDYRIKIFTSYKELCVQFLNCNIMTIDKEELFGYNTEPEFIEALQLACIKYLELKNEN